MNARWPFSYMVLFYVGVPFPIISPADLGLALIFYPGSLSGMLRVDKDFQVFTHVRDMRGSACLFQGRSTQWQRLPVGIQEH